MDISSAHLNQPLIPPAERRGAFEDQQTDMTGQHTLEQAQLRRAAQAEERMTAERCAIAELSNGEFDPEVSIARARVAAGATTRWHRLIGIRERYVVLEGRGRVEVGDLGAQDILPGDVVLIPDDCRQRVTALGDTDLLFLAICSPRFRWEAYEDIDD